MKKTISIFILVTLMYGYMESTKHYVTEHEELTLKLQQHKKLNNAIAIIKRRSPAVGGLVLALQSEIEKGNDVSKELEKLPETDLAILKKEMIIKHGLSKYAWRDEFSYPISNVNDSFISSEYGKSYINYYDRKFKRTRLRLRTHMGIDIVNRTNRQIFSVGDGEVVYSGMHRIYGNTIIIKHSINNINYISCYAHLSELKVKKSDIVKKNDFIGVMGSTGIFSTGIHLHFEIKRYDISQGKYVTINPLYNTTYNIPVETCNYKGMEL